MLRNYLKTALRFLLKNKTFSFINIFGLAAGTLCCLYILLYVQDQYSYDKQHPGVQDIYRVTSYAELTGDKHKIATASPPIGPALKRDFAEVAQFTRLFDADIFVTTHSMLQYNQRSFDENGFVFVDSTFFNVFAYHFVYGKNTHGVLAQPYSIVLVKPVAVKLFGNQDPVGKVVTINNNFGKHDYKVTGVVDESLGKTHIKANIFVTIRSGGFGNFLINNSQWAGNNNMCTYVKLRPGTDAAALEQKLPAFLQRHGAQALKALGMTKTLHLQPVTAIHTAPGYEFEIDTPLSPTLLGILVAIAVMIQLVACINFMNLSTARASKRAKEVGVRKVIGAMRGNLVRQFLGESFLLTLAGVVLAIPLLYIALPYLNQVTQANIGFNFFSHASVWLLLAAIVVITGAVAGSYPAFYLSAFKAIKVIKGNFTSHASASHIRRALVVFQFSLSIVLITAVIIIYSQLNYIKNKDLGFDTKQKLVFSFYTDDTRKNMPALAADLRQLSEVSAVSMSDTYFSHSLGSDFPVYLAGGNQETAVDAENMGSDNNFVPVNGIKILAGRNFYVKDTLAALINETLCKRLGLSVANAPGTRLYSKYFDGSAHSYEIAGVMKDFNYSSLRGQVGPFMIFYQNSSNNFSYITAAVNSSNYKGLLAKMEKVWQKNMPGAPFEYAFLDEEVQKQYTAEISLSNIINSFTLMAIVISCLGLFGLAAFSAEQRQKEIGIRKVLGASVAGVAVLLSKEFVRLVGIAFILATPVSWWATNQWLQGFAYKVPIVWWMFAVAGIITVCIALFTVSFQAIKAALANPVRALKAE